jgi:hypothetical protein
MRRRLVQLAVCVATVAMASSARALDPFEIQVYDGTANEPGRFGLELHLNRVATGYASATAPELPLRGAFHATLEPSFGVFPWWELGAYLQTALRADHRFDYAGVKLRSKFVTPPSLLGNFRLGLNVELSYLPTTYDRDQWGGELRPILAWDDERWLFAVNPIIDVSLAGQGLHAGPSFEPAVHVSRTLFKAVAVGIEYYGDFGPIASPLPATQQIHQLFGVLDLEAFPNLELELGLGGGVSIAAQGLIGKVILGTTFEVIKQRPAHPAMMPSSTSTPTGQ